MIDRIVKETINEYLKNDHMLKEYRNPNDGDTVRVCADQLENLYNKIISNGTSRNEYTVTRLYDVIKNLRKIEKWFSL